MFYLLHVIIEHGVMLLNHPFSYAYKGEKKISKGMRVKVNFANRELIGFVVDEPLKIDEDLVAYNQTSSIKLKEIADIIDDEPIINDELFDLATKTAEYYVCPLIEVLKSMLPPSLRPNSGYQNKPKRSFKEVYRLNREYKQEGLSKNEQALIDKFLANPSGFSKSEISSKASLQKLLDKKIVELFQVENQRLPFIDAEKEEAHVLNEEQQKAYDTIVSCKDKIYLIQGITGSGKTDIYISLARYYLSLGMSSLILVPEIALTDRMIYRFKSIFGEEAALLHSGLTDSQKYDEYLHIAKGEAHIVIGARSAIFAPVVNLGLIIIDEEHVESYKQDTMPFYDARLVARFRVEKEGRKLIFGSATPSLDCRARADKGIYHLIRLEHRFNKGDLPEVSLINLSDLSNIDYQSSLISVPLRTALAETLAKKEQAIVLLNRRGFAPIYTCRSCQKVLKCPNCNLPLTYHKDDHEIMCHHCGYILNSDDLVCPKCGHKDFSYTGFGTQRVEEELQTFLPEAKICRLDADSARKKGAYHTITTGFAEGKYDIMIGTQMVAKGHDFPNVTLAVALLADQSLQFPSYKADEDTFDLLTQLAGRAGRNDKPGHAIIQTYNPDNEVIKYACLQDYEAFYKYEMDNRHERQYPPYTYLADITVSASDRKRVEEAAYRIKDYLISELIPSNKRASIFGPSIPYIEKLANRYFRKIMIKYKNRALIEETLKGLYVLKLNSSDIRIVLDIDPSSDI